MPTQEVAPRQRILDTAEQIMSHKGYAAVGLNEILSGAGIPKGSFYHWFDSKDAFGEALIASYFEHYLAGMDAIVARSGSSADRLSAYWQDFYDMQAFNECQGKCLVVKLGAEVADLSEAMRQALIVGTSDIAKRIERMIQDGVTDGSVTIDVAPSELALDLYTGWIGASVLAKINRAREPLDRVFAMTRHRLNLS